MLGVRSVLLFRSGTQMYQKNAANSDPMCASLSSIEDGAGEAAWLGVRVSQRPAVKLKAAAVSAAQIR